VWALARALPGEFEVEASREGRWIRGESRGSVLGLIGGERDSCCGRKLEDDEEGWGKMRSMKDFCMIEVA